MTPFGAKSRTNSSLTSFGWISQNTCASRTRRAMSCVTCEPKSRIRMRSCVMVSGVTARGLEAAAASVVEVGPGQAERDRLDHRTEVERRADAPVAARQVRYRAEQRRADHRRHHRHQ